MCGEFLRSIFFRVMLSLFVVVVVAFLERKKETRRVKFNKKEKIVIPSRASSLLNSQIAPINGSRTTSCNKKQQHVEDRSMTRVKNARDE